MGKFVMHTINHAVSGFCPSAQINTASKLTANDSCFFMISGDFSTILSLENHSRKTLV